RVRAPPPPNPVRVVLAALGPEMLELAGEIADGVVLNWIPPETVPASIKHLEAGARTAGRTLAGIGSGWVVRTWRPGLHQTPGGGRPDGGPDAGGIRDRVVRPHVRHRRRAGRARGAGARHHRIRDGGLLRELLPKRRLRRRGRRGERGLALGRPRGRREAGVGAIPRRPRRRGARGLLPGAHRGVPPRRAHPAGHRAVRARWLRRARGAAPDAARLSVSAALSVLGVIPARLPSTRLPRKVLREIAGKPLIVHVFEAARRASDLAELLVATDSDEVVSACAKFGVPAVMTSAEHPSGTDRIWEVAQKGGAAGSVTL